MTAVAQTCNGRNLCSAELSGTKVYLRQRSSARVIFVFLWSNDSCKSGGRGLARILWTQREPDTPDCTHQLSQCSYTIGRKFSHTVSCLLLD